MWLIEMNSKVFLIKNQAKKAEFLQSGFKSILSETTGKEKKMQIENPIKQ